MTKFKNEETIKEMIVDGKRRGVCDGEGDSIHDSFGRAKAKTHNLGCAAVTYIYRNGKMVKRNMWNK